MQPFLSNLLSSLHLKNYVELGTTNGNSFSACHCLSIGISPYYSIEPKNPIKAPLKLFRCSSSEFFLKHNIYEELGQNTIDFCFIDEAHHFEALLKDFIELEKYSNSSSIIAFDNVLPRDFNMASRSYPGGWWMGDIWKVIPILKTWRPDLKLMIVDEQSTGVALVTHLDNSSKILVHNMSEIVDQYMNYSFTTFQALIDLLNPRSPSDSEIREFITQLEINYLSEVKHLDWSAVEYSSFSSDKGGVQVINRSQNNHSRTVKRYPPIFIDDHASAEFANHLSIEKELYLDDDFCVCISNGRVLGYRTIVTEDNFIFNDQIVSSLDAQKEHLLKLCGIQSGVRQGKKGNVVDEFTDLRQIKGRFFSGKLNEIDEFINWPTVCLSSQEPANYASWLFRFLPKLNII